MSNSKKANRLIHSTSPYLLQHAYNPVDWFEWGIEALAKAKKEDKPILVSIGYSSCHWCHVMERESFGLVPRPMICLNSIMELTGRSSTMLRTLRASTPVDSFCDVVKIVGMFFSLS